MKHTFRLVFFISLMISKGYSNELPLSKNIRNINISWEIIQNNYLSKTQSLSRLIFTNPPQSELSEKGWKIYFNFARQIDISTVSGPLRIENVNGDLFCITPTNQFKGLKGGKSIKVEFVSSAWVINYTDAPEGFYFIDESTPKNLISIKNITIIPTTKPEQQIRTSDDHVGFTTPQMVFHQNENIETIAASKLIKIFPTPVNYLENGKTFLLDASVRLDGNTAFINEIGYLRKEIDRIFGKSATKNANRSGKIDLKLKPNLTGGSYELHVDSNEIIISASDSEGIFYGIQSLKSLLPPKSWSQKLDKIAITGVDVKDFPRFPYRALLLDVARNFQTKKQILRILDLMALYKLNVFHFHLNDDEGWRLEIPSLPELTSVGSKRGHTLTNGKYLQPSYGSGPEVNTEREFYSNEDFIEILKYAKERHISVIPEIETPGHARAAVISMKARYHNLIKQGKKEDAERYLLTDFTDSSSYRSVQYWNDNVMDVSLPSTYNFIETVTNDIIGIYKQANAPLQTIHFGGDEVPAGVWQKSPSVKKLMDSNAKIKTVDDLWYYYFENVNNILKKHNLFLSGWEEIAMRKTEIEGQKTTVPNPDFVDKNFQVDVWNNVSGWGAEDLAYKLANAGYKVVLSGVSNLYFDMAYQKSFDEPGYYWGGYNDVDKVFKFIPYNYLKNSKIDRMGNAFSAKTEALSEKGELNIIGLKGLLWSETVKGPQQMEYMLLPKLLGLAERAWAKNPEWATEQDSAKSDEMYKRAWSHFTNILAQRELPRLDKYSAGFKYRIPTAGAVVKKGSVFANVQFPGMVIRYTTDNSEPTNSSARYSGPINHKGILKFSVFNTAGRGSRSISIVNK